jgi:hypothetical protein
MHTEIEPETRKETNTTHRFAASATITLAVLLFSISSLGSLTTNSLLLSSRLSLCPRRVNCH